MHCTGCSTLQDRFSNGVYGCACTRRISALDNEVRRLNGVVTGKEAIIQDLNDQIYGKIDQDNEVRARLTTKLIFVCFQEYANQGTPRF